MQTWLRACLVAVVLAVFANTASACPMCKEANETDDAKPRAYMYSILFMMGMPAAIFTGFGLSMYRLHRKQQLADAELFGQLNDGTANDEDSGTNA